MPSTTSRALKILRSEGYSVDVTERWIPHSFIKHDLFGVFDLIAMKPGEMILGIQVTSCSNMLARCRKILAEPRALTWCLTGHGRILVIGDEKRKDRHYWPMCIEIDAHDFAKEWFEA
jgi:hypothetical protein